MTTTLLPLYNPPRRAVVPSSYIVNMKGQVGLVCENGCCFSTEEVAGAPTPALFRAATQDEVDAHREAIHRCIEQYTELRYGEVGGNA